MKKINPQKKPLQVRTTKANFSHFKNPKKIMTISKQKAKAKVIFLLAKVREEINELAETEGMGYCHITHVPSGLRLLRYARKARVKIRCGYMFSSLRFVHL